VILTEWEIAERIIAGDIVVTPILDPAQQFGPTSLDIRLGTDFRLVDSANLTHLDPLLDPAKQLGQVERYNRKVKVAPLDPFILHPGEFALAASLEFVRIGPTISARVEGRSSWGRLGLLIHATAGFVDPGFAGSITFELHNVGPVPIPLYPGVRIAQLCFFPGETTTLPYGQKQFTKYSGRVGAQESMYFNDPEYATIRARREALGLP
jgi:dCTP deaminase